MGIIDTGEYTVMIPRIITETLSRFKHVLVAEIQARLESLTLMNLLSQSDGQSGYWRDQ